MMLARDTVIQNLKIIKTMKAVGRTDREIVEYLGIKMREFLDVLESDEYIREIYANAGDEYLKDLEEGFLLGVMQKIDEGKLDDAKWTLERLNPKYNKTEKVAVDIKSIDELIRERADE